MGSDEQTKSFPRLAVYGTLTILALGFSLFIARPFRWFSLHPLLMLLAFLAAGSAGIEAKRRGGRVNTLLHGYTMCGALVLALGGWYVIYQQKIMLGKPHNTSWHAIAGLVAIGGYALGAAGGLAALHPDFGLARTNLTFRSLHKLSSRLATTVAFIALVSGWMKLDGLLGTTCLGAVLAGLAWQLLRSTSRPLAYAGLPQELNPVIA